MVSASLLETISVIREPPKCRPQRLLRWNPLLQPPRPQFPLIRSRNPIRFALRCASRPQSAAAGDEQKGRPLDVVLRAVLETLDRLKKPAAAIILIGFLLTADSHGVLAASGGRMGAVILLSGFLSDRADDGSVLTATQKTSVIKLQVGLLGIARSFQKDLDQIAEAADTSTPEGLNYILTETTLALLRRPDCCISAYSSVDVKRSIEDGEKRFNQLSIEERGKFDEETLVNVNNIRRQKTGNQTFRSFSNEYIVVTILVAAEGVYKLPVINGSGDLKEALQKLGSIPSSKTLAVEVLWTPQNENDTLSERELLEDYPLLRPL
ncbi:hypothetical protein OPV22_033455 [Ensete ventricosum]|uniref:Uncharacterized protein n=1 Tax=Ensete ventricosum TaxID=4639 RepID=A0AAV8Q238_ENSVE|nr:hypothetical protein OPV22_033455 [Ensete ventricosum]